MNNIVGITGRTSENRSYNEKEKIGQTRSEHRTVKTYVSPGADIFSFSLDKDILTKESEMQNDKRLLSCITDSIKSLGSKTTGAVCMLLTRTNYGQPYTRHHLDGGKTIDKLKDGTEHHYVCGRKQFVRTFDRDGGYTDKINTDKLIDLREIKYDKDGNEVGGKYTFDQVFTTRKLGNFKVRKFEDDFERIYNDKGEQVFERFGNDELCHLLDSEQIYRGRPLVEGLRESAVDLYKNLLLEQIPDTLKEDAKQVLDKMKVSVDFSVTGGKLFFESSSPNTFTDDTSMSGINHDMEENINPLTRLKLEILANHGIHKIYKGCSAYNSEQFWYTGVNPNNDETIDEELSKLI